MPARSPVYRVVPGFLLTIGVWTALTGARTGVTAASALLIWANLA